MSLLSSFSFDTYLRHQEQSKPGERTNSKLFKAVFSIVLGPDMLLYINGSIPQSPPPPFYVSKITSWLIQLVNSSKIVPNTCSVQFRKFSIYSNKLFVMFWLF